VDEDELRTIASRPDYYFFASNFAHLDNIIPHLVETSCNVASALPTTTTTATSKSMVTRTDSVKSHGAHSLWPCITVVQIWYLEHCFNRYKAVATKVAADVQFLKQVGSLPHTALASAFVYVKRSMSVRDNGLRNMLSLKARPMVEGRGGPGKSYPCLQSPCKIC